MCVYATIVRNKTQEQTVQMLTIFNDLCNDSFESQGFGPGYFGWWSARERIIFPRDTDRCPTHIRDAVHSDRGLLEYDEKRWTNSICQIVLWNWSSFWSPCYSHILTHVLNQIHVWDNACILGDNACMMVMLTFIEGERERIGRRECKNTQK